MKRTLCTVLAFGLIGLTTSQQASTAAADELPVIYGNGQMLHIAMTGWDSPVPGADDYSCKPSAEHPRPVVLTGSTFLSAAVNWTALAPSLHNHGFCVFTVDYGRQLYNIPPGLNGMDPIPLSAEQVRNTVDQILSATGAEKVDLVGHSQGGVVDRYYLNELGGAAKARQMVLLSSPYRATGLPVDMAAVARDMIPEPLYRAILYNGRIPPLYLNFLDPWTFGKAQVLRPEITYTVVTDIADEVGLLGGMIAPAGAANAATEYINDRCPFDFSQHFAQPYSPTAVAMITEILDPGYHATPPCTPILGYAL
ncbi:triacylglycerol lipase [Nocardia sp. CS682]|uniref:esterase/lipase family protein n=1 Tax=Nocardia sp. CS682 TaxID=1047172 RepID=UPI001075281D|nr:alpha/beta fold hydrolase [Nocardia sp. CS682]QBS45305.1 hypothetical protein DMB37_39740 [Nocardia sp. CS682]